MHTIVTEKMPDSFWKLISERKITDIIYCLNYENYDRKEDVEILLLRTHTIADKRFIDLFQNAKLIIRAGSGFDNIDVRYAISKNIKVCNTPNANVKSAFEHTIGFIFSLIKKHKITENNIKQNLWKQNLKYNLEISDLKILVVGVGRIGSLVAKTMQKMGAEVLGVDPFLSDKEKQKIGIDFVKYNVGLKWCNMITYHCPLTDETRNYFDFETLEALSNNTFILNVARGEIIDYDALYSGLSSHKIAGVAIDVFPQEPFHFDKKLDDYNIYLSPHVGAYTKLAKDRMAIETIEVWHEFVRNGKLLSEVDLRFI